MNKPKGKERLTISNRGQWKLDEHDADTGAPRMPKEYTPRKKDMGVWEQFRVKHTPEQAAASKKEYDDWLREKQSHVHRAASQDPQYPEWARKMHKEVADHDQGVALLDDDVVDEKRDILASSWHPDAMSMLDEPSNKYKRTRH